MTTPEPRFRIYPQNSPEAAARIVALALIADGRVKAAEVTALDALNALERLNLTRPRWQGVIGDLCADLCRSVRSDADGCVPGEALDRMLDEVADERMQRLVLQLCSAVVHADRELTEGESIVLQAAIERWGMHPDEHALLESVLYGADFQVRPRGSAASARLRLCLL